MFIEEIKTLDGILGGIEPVPQAQAQQPIPKFQPIASTNRPTKDRPIITDPI